MPSVQTQIEFISYIQRLVVEGEFTATYKFAMLHALADICVESEQLDEYEQLIIPFEKLIDKLLQLYWDHAAPFSVSQNESFVLVQNSMKQIKFISEIEKLKRNGITTFSKFKQSLEYPKVIKRLKPALKEGPLERLQKLANVEECFLYPHRFSSASAKGQVITLNVGIAFCFRRFYDLVVHIARNEWIKKIQSYKPNQIVLGKMSSLENFLFSNERRNLALASTVFFELQKGKCFYCKKPISNQDTAQVDHFIPFARYPNDTAHNFVLAHASCNNSKNDYLASFVHRDNWYEQNIGKYEREIEVSLGNEFIANSELSLAVCNWAYQQASQTGAKYWLARGEFDHDMPTQPSKMVAETKGTYRF
ncbi:hypothetical protein PALB_28420 [Pseudoalteromonas luteoviolacea B = ATCC 29581]|nr:hypothetical protein PALB_28420 [Pseudoalteromonas luteoviolacea B = ATCC 29581]